ncbi:hypothetical protein Q9L58_007249 [Maublancomyces gigas]|uniref:Uncharacterized protein n=1 Tax=Discina gigas TaxID=1032678 RepID=A0ABR3GCX2_9PEZI
MSSVHLDMSETREDDWVADRDTLLPGPAPLSSPSTNQPSRSPKAAMNKAISKVLAAITSSSDPLTGNTTRHDIRHQPTPLPIGNPSILLQKSTNRSTTRNLSPALPTHQFNPLFGAPIGGGPSFTPYNFQTSFPPLQSITPESRAGTPKRALTNPVNRATPAKRQAPTHQASMNDLLHHQNEDMTKEICELKMLITNLSNQMTNAMAALSRTVVGKVDGIH